MKGYVILDIKVHDAARYEHYKAMSGDSINKYGGRFIVRGGNAEVLEGSWSPSRVVVLEFETIQRAREWYNSPEYQDAKRLRFETATSVAVLVEGA
jgi:uncharacterized protein (DUF1330 family)